VEASADAAESWAFRYGSEGLAEVVCEAWCGKVWGEKDEL
jgi:hypothetical protein